MHRLHEQRALTDDMIHARKTQARTGRPTRRRDVHHRRQDALTGHPPTPAPHRELHRRISTFLKALTIQMRALTTRRAFILCRS
jgi:hypothetical protein